LKTAKSRLSPSLEDYMEIILELSLQGEKIRVTDIAVQLKNSKASVNQAIHALVERGLVVHRRYGPVELTPEGAVYAAQVRERHHLLRQFLMEVLGVEAETAECDACLMEHEISEETIECMIRFMTEREKPGSIPNGKSAGTR